MPDFDATCAAFTAIYVDKVWGGGSGASGPDLTQPYMRMLADFMHNNAVTSVVDVGCGDWQFSRVMDWSGIRYQGFDVVDAVIDLNKERFASDNITFATLRSISDLPKADLVVCKDVLQHLPNRDVNEYLDYFSTHYKYAIVTNDIFPDAYTNFGHTSWSRPRTSSRPRAVRPKDRCVGALDDYLARVRLDQGYLLAARQPGFSDYKCNLLVASLEIAVAVIPNLLAVEEGGSRRSTVTLC